METRLTCGFFKYSKVRDSVHGEVSASVGGTSSHFHFDIGREVVLHLVFLLQRLVAGDNALRVEHLHVGGSGEWLLTEGVGRDPSCLALVHERLELGGFALVHLSHGLVEEVVGLVSHLPLLLP